MLLPALPRLKLQGALELPILRAEYRTVVVAGKLVQHLRCLFRRAGAPCQQFVERGNDEQRQQGRHRYAREDHDAKDIAAR